MARRSILEMIRQVAPALGILTPNTVTGSTDLQVLQLLALANRDGRSLASRVAWQDLTKEVTFASLAAQDQGLINGTILPLTAGFSYILRDTVFDRTKQVGVGGPVSPRGWQALKGSAAVTGFYSQYRIREGHLYLFPAPGAGQTLAFEYVTENWVTNATGDLFRTGYSMDDDVPLLDSHLLELGLSWRWNKSKGLSYAEDFREYENIVLDAMTRSGNSDGGAARLDGNRRDGMQPMVVVAKGNWPL